MGFEGAGTHAASVAIDGGGFFYGEKPKNRVEKFATPKKRRTFALSNKTNKTNKTNKAMKTMYYPFLSVSDGSHYAGKYFTTRAAAIRAAKRTARNIASALRVELAVQTITWDGSTAESVSSRTTYQAIRSGEAGAWLTVLS